MRRKRLSPQEIFWWTGPPRDRIRDLTGAMLQMAEVETHELTQLLIDWSNGNRAHSTN